MVPRELRHQGLGGLNTAADLLVKMRNDLRRMEAEPRNAEPVFDFFVSAYHMPEWATEDLVERKRLRLESLQMVAGHIATRAKHRRADRKAWVQLVGVEDRAGGPLARTPRGLPTALQDTLYHRLRPVLLPG